MTKQCHKCNDVKPLDQFYRQQGCKNGIRGSCKSCRSSDRKSWAASPRGKLNVKNRNLKQYGITVEQYNNMHAEQDGKCAICNNPSANNRLLGLDHCHTTGQIRKLLCMECNTGLGKFKDSRPLLQKALNYLEVCEAKRLTSEIVRPFLPEDFEQVAGWAKSRGQPYDRDLFPPTGWIIDKVCAYFIYLTNTNVCFLENMISNPEVLENIRRPYLDLLIARVLKDIEQRGLRVAYATTSNPRLIRKAISVGSKIETNQVLLQLAIPQGR